MKKIIFALLLFSLISQVYGYQLFTDLLLWRVREGSADNWAQAITPSGTTQSANLLDAPFQWNTGFRLGVGSQSADQWDTLLYWTNYQTKATNAISGQIYSAFVGNYFANNTNGANFGPVYDSASMLWRFSYNTVDLEAGHTFHADKALALNPYVGIKTAFINQTINTTWQGPHSINSGTSVPITTFSTATETLKNNFCGLGPSIGIRATWPFYETTRDSFDLFGNFTGALLMGHWRFKDIYQNNTPVSITVNVSSVNGIAPMTGALLGAEWITHFTHSDLSVRLGYEMQVWFNQIQYYSLNMGRLDNLMSLQGGTLRLSYQFN